MNTIHYHEAIELGFKRIETEDEVFERQHGYPYFIVNMQINKNTLVEWDIETHELKLYKKHMFQKTITKSELLELIAKQPCKL